MVAAQRVEFRSDGLTLVGDLRAQPRGRRPGLVFTGPFTGSRDQVTGTYAAALAEAGYATLAFDHRSFGESGGLPRRDEDPQGKLRDLAAAVSFLRRQSGVEPSRIAALGLSMGGEQALRAAADGVPLRAVVADGAGASTLGDVQLTEHGPTAPISSSTTWLAMRATEAITGTAEPPPLKSIVGRISVPVLLIASERAGELQVDRAYRTQIGRRAILWHVADAGHTEALQRHPAAYRAHVGAFLAAATR